MSNLRAAVLAIVALSLGGLWLLACGDRRQDRIVVGSKNFTEQLVLGELIAQLLEAKTDLPVERRFYLAGTYICQQAMLAGRIDLYVEYSGTALLAVLKERPVTPPQVYDEVKKQYAEKFRFEVMPPLGFENTFALEIRGEDARRLRVKTISDMAAHAPSWRIGVGYEFMERADGYRGLASAYGLRFRSGPRIMDLGLLARALKDKQIDVAVGNSTDGLIPALDLFVLADDRHYFPPYEAVPVVRQEVLARHPEVAAALAELAGKISADDMRQMNYAVDSQHQEVKAVVARFLRERALLP